MRRRPEIRHVAEWLVVVFAVLSVSRGWRASAVAQGTSQSTDVSDVLACSPDSPIVSRGQVVLRAWTAPTVQPTDQLMWSVSSGQIRSNTSDTQWDLRGQPPNAYTATVRLRISGKVVASCDVRVVVPVGEETRDPRIAARAFLAHGQDEAKGYGLYSYLLFGSPPSKVRQPLYLNAIIAYLELVGDVDTFGSYLSPAATNITYVPTLKTPDSNVLAVVLKRRQASEEAAQWVLDNYDYARAQLALRGVTGQYGEGPYFISSSTPLAGARSTGSAFLIQDLSNVRPEFARAWVREFLNQTAQERYWESRTFPSLGLKLRHTLAHLARGFKETLGPLNTVITWRLPG